MIKLNNKLELNGSLIAPLMEKEDSLENYVILDIETTGFSAQYNMIYLLGYIYYEKKSFYLTQLLCEKKEDEYELLYRFSQAISNYKYVIHYNGANFDMPFIKKRLNLYNIQSKINELIEIDLYLRIKPFQTYFPVDNLKLKTIEKYNDFIRTDNYDGGELIQIFKNYLLSPTNDIKNKLLLHNREDLLGLYHSFKLLDLLFFFEKAATEAIEISDIQHEIYKQFLQIYIPYQFNNSFSINLDSHYILLNQNQIIIKVKIINDTLNYYYKDYKNYFYLPKEEQVIHKSLAKFVDKGHKIKATKENCYIKKRGNYVPLLKSINYKLYTFKYHRSAKEKYVELTEQLINNKEFIIQYTKSILSEL